MAIQRNGLKAIETVYSGYRFRSRLEARWAVFFDKLGIKYEYEYEGFSLDNGRYLPDFWLPDLNAWVEIKGPEPTEKEMFKAENLARYSLHSSCMVLSGSPWQGSYKVSMFMHVPTFSSAKPTSSSDITGFLSDVYRTDYDSFATCRLCSGFWLINQKEEIMCHPFSCSWKEDSWPIEDDTRLIIAYTAARQARFEHGEKPK